MSRSPILSEGDFFVVIDKDTNSYSNRAYNSAELQSAMYFASYEEALTEARERSVRKHGVTRIYRVHPVCKLEPQEPKIEEYK